MSRTIVRNINPKPQKRIKNMGFSSANFYRNNLKSAGKGAVPKGCAKGSKIQINIK
jgi:hypothetical protein